MINKPIGFAGEEDVDLQKVGIGEKTWDVTEQTTYLTAVISSLC